MCSNFQLKTFIFRPIGSLLLDPQSSDVPYLISRSSYQLLDVPGKSPLGFSWFRHRCDVHCVGHVADLRQQFQGSSDFSGCGEGQVAPKLEPNILSLTGFQWSNCLWMIYQSLREEFSNSMVHLKYLSSGFLSWSIIAVVSLSEFNSSKVQPEFSFDWFRSTLIFMFLRSIKSRFWRVFACQKKAASKSCSKFQFECPFYPLVI